MQGDPRYANITNRPGPNDVYQVAQNASYDLNDIDRERINGQAVLQFRPIDSLTATIDYTYSRFNLETHNSNVGIYYNHADTSSAWTDGPVASPDLLFRAFSARREQGPVLQRRADIGAQREQVDRRQPGMGCARWGQDRARRASLDG